MLGSGMAVDFIADPGNANNEDSEMLPCKPDPHQNAKELKFH